MEILARLKSEANTWAKVVVILFNVLACLIISAILTFYLATIFIGENVEPTVVHLSFLFIAWALLCIPLLFAASRINWRGRAVVAVAFVVYVILFGTTTTCAAAAASGC